MSQRSTVFPDPSVGGRTRQSEKDACDVNVIVRQHLRGGVTTHLTQRVGDYGYVPSLDFRENMEQLRMARELFMELPAQTRTHFANDPARFVEFVSDKANKQKLLDLGLLVPRAKPEPVLGSADNPMHVAPSAAPAASGSGSGGNPP